MSRVLTLNAAAASALAIAAAPRVRVRTVDGSIQIRPTDRTNTSNIPSNEILADVRGNKIGLPAELIGRMRASKFELVGEPRYGWHTLARTKDLPKRAAGATLN